MAALHTCRVCVLPLHGRALFTEFCDVLRHLYEPEELRLLMAACDAAMLPRSQPHHPSKT